MATLAELRAKAKRLGIAASVIRGASTVKELQSVIADFNEDGKPAKKTVAAKKKSTSTPVKRGPGRPRKVAQVEEEEEQPRKRRGRPPGSGVKKSASSTKAPARSRTSGTAKRPSTAKRTTKPAPKQTRSRKPAQVDADAGRFLLEQIDYSETEGWNPRPGSPPDRIVKALRKFRGNREKVYEFLKGDVYEFVGRKKQDGTPRTKAEALKMLRYRIARTDWEFATRTGQHQKSENRAEYGSLSGNGNSRTKKAAPKATPAKRGPGRPPKAAQAAPKRRGRPPGSKSKPKAAAGTQTRSRTKAKPATRRTATRRSRR